jgi:hypothetical protein
MPLFQPKSDGTYRAVYAAYMETDDPLTVIARRCRVGRRTIDRWRVRDAWPQRPSESDNSVASAADETDVPNHSRRPPSKQVVVRRLWTAIDRALTRLEQAMTSSDPLTPADSERETRAIGTLIRNLAKAAELETHVGQRAAQQSKPAPDAERLRQDLAERLRRLGGPAAGGSADGADRA